jgi:hypothetical protein
MRVQEIREALGRQPFRPFRIVLTDGGSFEVRHPELCMIGLGSMIIGLPPEHPTADQAIAYDRHVVVDWSHITRIEPERTPVTGNGAGG